MLLRLGQFQRPLIQQLPQSLNLFFLFVLGLEAKVLRSLLRLGPVLLQVVNIKEYGFVLGLDFPKLCFEILTESCLLVVLARLCLDELPITVDLSV